MGAPTWTGRMQCQSDDVAKKNPEMRVATDLVRKARPEIVDLPDLAHPLISTEHSDQPNGEAAQVVVGVRVAIRDHLADDYLIGGTHRRSEGWPRIQTRTFS